MVRSRKKRKVSLSAHIKMRAGFPAPYLAPPTKSNGVYVSLFCQRVGSSRLRDYLATNAGLMCERGTHQCPENGLHNENRWCESNSHSLNWIYSAGEHNFLLILKYIAKKVREKSCKGGLGAQGPPCQSSRCKATTFVPLTALFCNNFNTVFSGCNSVQIVVFKRVLDELKLLVN